MSRLTVLCLVLLVLPALFGLDQLGLWMERRGWIYWRKKKSQSSVLGSGALAFQDLLEGGKATHVLEAKETRPVASPKTGPGPV